MDVDDKLPITDHLEELRKRLIYSLIAIAVGFVGAYFFKEQLFGIITKPLIDAMPPEQKLIFTGLPEAFFTYLKIAFLAGIFLAAPVIFYQFWLFIAPGLYTKEKRLLLPAIFLSTFFFVGGVAFCYYIVFPIAITFFLGQQSATVQAMISMREYLSFSTKLMLAFGLAFELPLVNTLLAKLGIVNANFLKKQRKYAILIIFTVSAILTPPDVVSQIMMAIPLMGLYELSIVGAKIFGKKPSKKPSDDENVTI